MKSLKSMKLKNKYVILRADIDVPLDKKGKITDDSRLKAMVPTLEYLRKKNAMTIVIGHIDRPKGKIVDKLKTDVVAERLARLLKHPVFKLDDCIGQDVEYFVDEMVDKEIVVLENLRFYEEEKKNSIKFARSLADLGNIYVNDCFSTCHRKHASIVGIPKFLPSCIGFNVEKEIKGLEKARKPKKPFMAILGAAKISDKIGLIDALCKKVDKLLLGGAIIFTFLKAQGYEVGKSLVDDSKIKDCKRLLKKYKDKIILPVDIVVAKSRDSKQKKTVAIDDIPKSYSGYDIGKKTISLFEKELKKAKTVFWNGPLGVFEKKAFANGTRKIAKILADSKKIIIIGGGDTGAAIHKYKLAKKFTHVSTAGGAAIEYVEGNKLPGFKKQAQKSKVF